MVTRAKSHLDAHSLDDGIRDQRLVAERLFEGNHQRRRRGRQSARVCIAAVWERGDNWSKQIRQMTTVEHFVIAKWQAVDCVEHAAARLDTYKKVSMPVTPYATMRRNSVVEKTHALTMTCGIVWVRKHKAQCDENHAKKHRVGISNAKTVQ